MAQMKKMLSHRDVKRKALQGGKGRAGSRQGMRIAPHLGGRRPTAYPRRHDASP